MKVFLVCFDISDDRLRLKVGKTLLEYGDRIQKSVFELMIHSDEQYQNLLDSLQQVLASAAPNTGDDDNPVNDEVDIRFYRLCKTCQSHSHSIDEESIDFSEVAYFPAAVVI